MSEHFIKNIDIIKFKCFDNFSASGFSRVNLISGKNNVGKTAFMEAVYVNVFTTSVNSLATSLFGIKYMRENINLLTDIPKNHRILFMESIKYCHTISNHKEVLFKLKEGDGEKEYLFDIDNNQTFKSSNEFVFLLELHNRVLFIDNFGWSNNEIVSAYASVQKNDKEEYLNKILNKFDSRIESFKVIESKPQCKINGEYIELTEFGDGLRHLISIVSAIFASENGYLFIDEIDNGIHYTQLEEIWKIIFEVSEELNCQVFATTHSKEMINSFVDTAKKEEFEDVSFIEFGLKEGEIKSLVYDYKDLLSERDQNHEIRGW